MLTLDRNFSGTLSRNIEDYPDGIVVVVYKPYRWTSADVIRKVKFAAIRHFGKKNLKVGHAGTLDPLATGVLLVCLGAACKKAMQLQASDKEYIAGVCLGASTASYDLEKEVVPCEGPVPDITGQMLLGVLLEFVGEQDQVAPLFSAKQVDGVRAYEIARKMLLKGQGQDEAAQDGTAVRGLDEAAAQLVNVNHITISETQLLSFGLTAGRTAESLQDGASSRINVAPLPAGLPEARIRIACSKGTYIRSFARDLGERLGTEGFLSSLERSRSGSFRASDALSPEAVLEFLKKA